MTVTDRMLELEKKQIRLRGKLAQMLTEGVGENPAIKRLSERSFTIRSSDMFRHGNWTPKFHDWQAAMKEIVETIDKLEPIKAVAFLHSVVKTGAIRYRRGYQTLHPELVTKLKEILNSEKVQTRSEKTPSRVETS
jgi:hypothetical protein